MQVGSYFVAVAQPLELVEPGESALYHPPSLAQSGAVRGATPGDLRGDSSAAQESAVLVVVVATAGEEPPGTVAGTTAQTADPGDGIEQRYRLGDVVSVTSGQRHCKRSAVPVDDQMVFAAQAAPVDRGWACVEPPLRARMCEPSMAQSSISSKPAARSSVSRAALSRLAASPGGGSSLILKRPLPVRGSTFVSPHRPRVTAAGRGADGSQGWQERSLRICLLPLTSRELEVSE